MMTLATASAQTYTLYVISDNSNIQHADENILEGYDATSGVPITFIGNYSLYYANGSNGAVGMAVDDVLDKLYVTQEFSGVVYVFNATNFNYLNADDINLTDNLAGIDADSTTQTLYVADRCGSGSNIYVINAITGNLITTVNTNLYCILGIALDPVNNNLYIATGNNTVYVMDTTTNNMTGTTYTFGCAHVGIAVDYSTPADVYLYTTSFDRNSGYPNYTTCNDLVKYRINNGATTIQDINGSTGVTVNPATGYGYVTVGYPPNYAIGHTASIQAFDMADLSIDQIVPLPDNWTPTDLYIAETIFVPYCGNGVVDPGEQCDPPDGITCDANCQFIGPPIIKPPKYIVEENPYDICVCEKAVHAVDTQNPWGWWLAQPCMCPKRDRTFWFEDVCTANKAWGYYWAFTWHNLCVNFPEIVPPGNPWPMNTTTILELENETIEIV